MSQDFIRCPKCKGQLFPSGVEVHRHICGKCGQHYYAILQFIPVEPLQRPTELLGSGDVNGDTASTRGGKIPE